MDLLIIADGEAVFLKMFCRQRPWMSYISRFDDWLNSQVPSLSIIPRKQRLH